MFKRVKCPIFCLITIHPPIGDVNMKKFEATK